MEGGAICAPFVAGVLQCELAGLGWPPNTRTPCAGLPRRLLRGECAGARDMPEADAASDSDEPRLVLPEPSGEDLSSYVRRAIVDDPAFNRLRQATRYFDAEIVMPSVCRPASFTARAVEAYHQAFARLNQDPRADGFSQMTNHLWSGRHQDLPFAVRMAQTPNPAVSEVFLTEKDTPRPWIEALRVVRKAAHHRDSLMAGMFDAIHCGRWLTSGFMPSDHLRQLVPIEKAWWADDQMQCDWTRSELYPRAAATPGRPMFLGISLAVALQQPSFSTQERGVEPALQPTRKTHRNRHKITTFSVGFRGLMV